ncbi:MAG: DUF2917 domain-containing protein [Burkholderiales bacterium]
MKPIYRSSKSPGAPIDLAANEAISVPGRRGMSIRCVRGQVWVTQEGDMRDYIVPRGLRFVVARGGRIVVNGAADYSTVEVGDAEGVGTGASVLRVDWQCFALIESEARRARAAYFATAWGALSAAGRRAGRRVVGWLAGAMTEVRFRKPRCRL